jgi:hypothetical protein
VRLGASQRSTTRRCASHHIATQRASRWGHPGGSRAFSAGGPGTINTKDYCSKRKGFLMMVYQEKIVPPGSLPVLASEPPDVLLSQRTIESLEQENAWLKERWELLLVGRAPALASSGRSVSRTERDGRS